MVATIAQMIAAINPDLYCKNSEEVKKILKEKGFQAAAEKADSQAINYEFNPNGTVKISKSAIESKHRLVYDSSSETLEPVYFWLLDFMNDMIGLEVEKLVDNFTSSPGSGHFSELGQRATVMQQQGSKILGDVNTVLRSVLNLIYDLKEFKIRLQYYDELNSSKKETKEAALLSLKQIWLDKVDVLKGNTSIKGMSLGQAGFQTLLDAFLVAKDEKQAAELDLNDRVKRIVLSRISEFNIWLKQSEEELRKRYQLERIYLKSQVNSLKLYSRWARPYLKAAQDLEQKERNRDAAIVKAFNTIVIELALLGKTKIKVKEAAIAGDLPKDFEKLKLKREYYSCVLVSFIFRGIPQRVCQQAHYVFGGRVEVTFSAYALNKEELAKLDFELDKSDLGEVLKLIQGTTTESLEQLQKEIDYFLKDESPEEKKEKARSSDQSNPFLALIGQYDREKVKEEKPSSEEKQEPVVKKEDYIEKNVLRPFAAENAVNMAFNTFDVYKKSHKMPSWT